MVRIATIILLSTCFFISCGYDITPEGQLERAMESNSFKEISTIIESQPSLVDYHSDNGSSLVHFSIKSTNDSLLQFLVNNNADLNQKDAYGRTPLYYLNRPELLSQLTLMGANLNVQDSLGNTLYHWYTDKYMLHRFIELAVQEVHIDKKNGRGMTALMEAIIKDEFIKAQILVNYGADVRSKNVNGMDCVEMAEMAEMAGNYKIYEFVKKNFDQKENFSTLKIKSIHSATVQLTGEIINTTRSFSLSEVEIPRDCDELIFVGYGKSEKPQILTRLEELVDLGATLYGEEAEEAYEKYKNLSSMDESGSRVDFFLTSPREASILRGDPDYLNQIERFASADNVSSFSMKLEREVNLPPGNEFVRVIKNENEFSQASFTLNILCVTFPRDDYEELIAEIPIESTPTKKETANLGINPAEVFSRRSPEKHIVTEPVIRKSLLPNRFYTYPELVVENINSIYFIQGGAKRSLNEAERFASLYKNLKFNVWILKKGNGEYPFKILVDHLNDKQQVQENINIIRRKYRKDGDLYEAFLVRRSSLIDK